MWEKAHVQAKIVIGDLHVLLSDKGIGPQWLRNHYNPLTAKTQKDLELRIVRLQGVLDGLVLAGKLSKEEVAPIYDELSEAYHTSRK